MSPQWSWPATPRFSPAASAMNAGRSAEKPVNDSKRIHSFQNCQTVSRVRGSANTRSSCVSKPASVASESVARRRPAARRRAASARTCTTAATRPRTGRGPGSPRARRSACRPAPGGSRSAATSAASRRRCGSPRWRWPARATSPSRRPSSRRSRRCRAGGGRRACRTTPGTRPGSSRPAATSRRSCPASVVSRALVLGGGVRDRAGDVEVALDVVARDARVEPAERDRAVVRDGGEHRRDLGRDRRQAARVQQIADRVPVLQRRQLRERRDARLAAVRRAGAERGRAWSGSGVLPAACRVCRRCP